MVRRAAIERTTPSANGAWTKEHKENLAICDGGSTIAIRVQCSGPAGFRMKVDTDRHVTIQNYLHLDDDCGAGRHDLQRTCWYTEPTADRPKKLLMVDDKDIVDFRGLDDKTKIDRWSCTFTTYDVMAYTRNGTRFRAASSAAVRPMGLTAMAAASGEAPRFNVGNLHDGDDAVAATGEVSDVEESSEISNRLTIHFFVPKDMHNKQILLDLGDAELPSDW
jgi:hypothetical protein